MDTTTFDAQVSDFLAQKRIAIAGVSGRPSDHPVGNLIFRRLQDTGHEVFPVNPRLQTFEGSPCYPDLASIPGGVDAVMIVTRPEITERLVRDCEREGIHHVWMHQSLNKGTSVSPEAVAFCKAHGIDVIAGGCPMMFGEGVDFGHTCLRLLLSLTGKMPA